MAETQPKEEKKKSVLGKVKDAILPDQEEQAAIISTMVRIGVLVWSGGILTLNYVAIPGVPQQKIDPTFIASVFTGVLSSLGIQTASKKGDGTYKSEADKPMNKKEIETLLANNQNGAVQTIRVITPLRIEGAEVVKYDPITGKEIDPQSGKLT
jgi:hypothetical protein